MNEVIFVVEEAPEGGYSAQALGPSIFTQAGDFSDLTQNVRDAVRCHYDDGQRPAIIRLHFSREQLLVV